MNTCMLRRNYLQRMMLLWISSLLTFSVDAGYRNIDSVTSKKSDVSERNQSVALKKNELPARKRPQTGWSKAEIKKDSQVVKLKNNAGDFGNVTVAPLGTIEVELNKPDWQEGEGVFAYTVNGGRINGEISAALTVGKKGKLVFDFQAGPHLGNYAVVMRHGGAEEVIEFWVREKEPRKKGGVSK